MLQCPICFKFPKEVYATINGLGEIEKVEGTCKKHGLVDLTNQDWEAEDFATED